MQPCRILLSHFVGGSGSVTGFSSGFDYASVQAHRLCLEESKKGSELVLTYDSWTKYTMLEGSWAHRLKSCWLSTAWTVRSDIRYDFMLSRLWEDNVCLRPTFDVYEIDLHSEVRMTVECYSGAQVWYPKDDTGALHGQIFD